MSKQTTLVQEIITVEAENDKPQRRELLKNPENYVSINVAELSLKNITSDSIKANDVKTETCSKKVIQYSVFAWHINNKFLDLLFTSSCSQTA